MSLWRILSGLHQSTAVCCRGGEVLCTPQGSTQMPNFYQSDICYHLHSLVQHNRENFLVHHLQWWDFAFGTGVFYKYQKLINKLLVKESVDNEKLNSVGFVLITAFQSFCRFSGPGYMNKSCALTCTRIRWVMEWPNPNSSVGEEYGMTFFSHEINGTALTFHIYCS